MTRSRPRTFLGTALTALVLVCPLGAQARDPNTIVIVTGQQATVPVPTLMEGADNNLANLEVADQLFLRLAGFGPSLTTVGERDFVPRLARSWSRQDSLTLVFDLDPRARWHDGVPVTGADVVFTFERARNPAIAPRLADLLRHISSVTAEGERRVVVRFSQPYAEQFYDVVYHVAPLPSHLLMGLTQDELKRSEFVRNPVGNGPYRWVRSVPGQFIELAANKRFFLGRPAVARVFVRIAADPDARINFLLSGEADALENIVPPIANLARIEAARNLRLVPVPSPTVGYLLFNQRAPGDPERPHPILADRSVRRAITLSLDRQALVQSVFGTYAQVPFGPAAPILWIRHNAPAPLGPDPAAAGRLLSAAGWVDRDGDGVLDRDGRPLLLRLNFPNTSAVRGQMALQVQEQLRRVGIAIELQRLEVPVWLERRSGGHFDIDFSSASQDPSPSGLTQSWSCSGGDNVAHYCNARVDTLMERAIRGTGNPADSWHEVLRQIEDDAPATFLYAPSYVHAIDRRFGHVTIRPESSWLELRQWTVERARERPRSGY